jgi:hypothetical protein
LSDAVIVAVPTATAVTVIVALDEPAWTVTGVCTAATAGLLLESEILDPPVGAAAVRLTVPCPVLPAATLVAFSVTPDTAGVVVVGTVGEPEPPHCIIASAATTVVASVTNGVARRLILKKKLPLINSSHDGDEENASHPFRRCQPRQLNPPSRDALR